MVTNQLAALIQKQVSGGIANISPLKNLKAINVSNFNLTEFIEMPKFGSTDFTSEQILVVTLEILTMFRIISILKAIM